VSLLAAQSACLRQRDSECSHIKEDIFRKDCGEARKYFFRAPALALEIHNVGLHEHCTTVAEHSIAFAENARSRTDSHSDQSPQPWTEENIPLPAEHGYSA